MKPASQASPEKGVVPFGLLYKAILKQDLAGEQVVEPYPKDVPAILSHSRTLCWEPSETTYFLSIDQPAVWKVLGYHPELEDLLN